MFHPANPLHCWQLSTSQLPALTPAAGPGVCGGVAAGACLSTAGPGGPRPPLRPYPRREEFERVAGTPRPCARGHPCREAGSEHSVCRAVRPKRATGALAMRWVWGPRPLASRTHCLQLEGHWGCGTQQALSADQRVCLPCIHVSKQFVLCFKQGCL